MAKHPTSNPSLFASEEEVFRFADPQTKAEPVAALDRCRRPAHMRRSKSGGLPRWRKWKRQHHHDMRPFPYRRHQLSAIAPATKPPSPDLQPPSAPERTAFGRSLVWTAASRQWLTCVAMIWLGDIGYLTYVRGPVRAQGRQMEMITTCINCLPASASAAVTMAFAITLLVLSVYRSA